MSDKNIDIEVKKLTNRDLLIPYAVPYFAFVAIVIVGSKIFSKQVTYALVLCIVPLILYWAWKWYVPFTGPKKNIGSILWGIVFGLAGLAIWCVLLVPFIDLSGEPWDFSAFILRAVAASLIVPIFEEIFIRGYILRAALQWDQNRKNKQIASPLGQMLDHDNIGTVLPGAWSVMAVGISSITFAAGHMLYEWPAAMAYSLLISVLWIMRKDLLSCVVAHGVTNFTLAVYVYSSGNWGFW